MNVRRSQRLFRLNARLHGDHCPKPPGPDGRYNSNSELDQRGLARQIEPRQWVLGSADPSKCASGRSMGAQRRDANRYAHQRAIRNRKPFMMIDGRKIRFVYDVLGESKAASESATHNPASAFSGRERASHDTVPPYRPDVD